MSPPPENSGRVIKIDYEEINETIGQFPVLLKEFHRLKETALENGSRKENTGFFVSVASGQDRLVRRLERLERRITTLYRLIDVANLPDKDWSILDCFMSGLPIKQMKYIFSLSDTSLYRKKREIAQVLAETYQNAIAF